MQFYPFYNQHDVAEVESLIQTQKSCRLITSRLIDGINQVHYGILNHFASGQDIYLHLNSHDEQISDLRAIPHALVVFEDLLALIPSYWTDNNDASAATAYYRYAEFTCKSDLIKDPSKVRDVLQAMMDRHQPEGKYVPLEESSDLYKESFEMLTIVKLQPLGFRTKWKLGQNRSPSVRRHIAAQLRLRGESNDFRTADEIEKSVNSRNFNL